VKSIERKAAQEVKEAKRQVSNREKARNAKRSLSKLLFAFYEISGAD